LDKDGVVSSFTINFPENPSGIISALDGQGIEKAHLADLPNDSVSSAAAGIPIANLFTQVNNVAKLSGLDGPLTDWIEMVENLTGLKFSEEILDSFEGPLVSYQKVTNTSLVSLRVKDKDQFAKRLATCIDSIRIEAEAVEGGQFKEKQYKDYTIYSFTQPPYLGPSGSWCHADDHFYIRLTWDKPKVGAIQLLFPMLMFPQHFRFLFRWHARF